jgi:hypothetical protein
MAEPTKALVLIIAIIVTPFILYFTFLFVKEYLEMKNAIHVDFKKENGKMKGYQLKDGKWEYDGSLQIDDEDIDDET